MGAATGGESTVSSSFVLPVIYYYNVSWSPPFFRVCPSVRPPLMRTGEKMARAGVSARISIFFSLSLRRNY